MYDFSVLDTPSLVLDVDIMQRNQARMRVHLDACGVALRPHLKTCKSLDVVRHLLPPDCPVTVSTLREAEYFADGGLHDIMYAVGVTPHKLPRIAALVRRGVSLCLVTDNVVAARAIAEFATRECLPLRVCLEIDCDGHRSGLAPDDPALWDVVAALQSPYVALQGVMTHAGAAYACTSTEAIVRLAEQERQAVVGVAAALRARGLACPTVSVGSTPTALLGRNFNGVTEVRAGVYMFMDLVMAGLGVCTPADIALSVLTSVIGQQRSRGWLIVDAGWMALSQDRGTAAQAVDQGWGMVCDVNGVPLADLYVMDANQEHGVIASRSGTLSDAVLDALPVGSLLRILPSHACATAAAFSSYHVCGHEQSPAVWPRCNGWA